MKANKLLALVLGTVMVLALVPSISWADDMDSKPASRYTKAINEDYKRLMDISDSKEMENAMKGLIEAPEGLVIYNDEGMKVFGLTDYDFLKTVSEIPDEVNPGLWCNTIYGTYAGLFEVCDGIYQVRGFDTSNITFIRTESGWVVLDALSCIEDAKAARELMEKHFGILNIKAVVLTGINKTQYGGIEGLISREDLPSQSLSLEEQLASGKTVVIASENFADLAMKDLVFAETAVERRAQYVYGDRLDKNEKGSLSLGIGLTKAEGTFSFIKPTYEIIADESVVIDGIQIDLMRFADGAESSDICAFFPDYQALYMNEACAGIMGSIYELEGSEVTDPGQVAKAILTIRQKYADSAEVLFQAFNWPHWGSEDIKQYMQDTAAVYKFINDQTLHYINLGYTSVEIADILTLPDYLAQTWYARQFYGTLSQNVKAVYNEYMGWYDANPVNLSPLTPEETARKWTEYLGNIDEVLKKAQSDFNKGEYQWVAQLTKEILYANPNNAKARELCADSLEQLGYQSESGAYRNAYLMGALELRLGSDKSDEEYMSNIHKMMKYMSVEMLLDYIGMTTDAKEAAGDDLIIDIRIEDTGDAFRLVRKGGVLLYWALNDATKGGDESESAENDGSIRFETSDEQVAEGDGEKVDAVVTCYKSQLLDLVIDRNGFDYQDGTDNLVIDMPVLGGGEDARQEVEVMIIEGDASAVMRLVKYCRDFTPDFNVVLP